MSRWNHRVMRVVDEFGEESFGIHEVYYASNGSIESWTVDPVAPEGSTLEELKRDYETMARALTMPILDA